MTDLDVNTFETNMWTAVNAVDAARAKLDAAQAEFDAARDAASTEIQRYGTVLTIEGAPVKPEVIRSLYWEHRDIRVDAIAKAFAIKGGAGAVHEHAGADYFDAPCPAGCDRTVRLKARTSPLRPCETCAAEQAAERQRHWAEWEIRREQENADRDAWIREQLLAGHTADELYVDLVARFETGGPLPHLRDMAAQLELEQQGPNPF